MKLLSLKIVIYVHVVILGNRIHQFKINFHRNIMKIFIILVNFLYYEN